MPHRAYYLADYDPASGRWQWVIVVNTENHSRVVARSVITYPTEREANLAAKEVRQQLRNSEAR